MIRVFITLLILVFPCTAAFSQSSKDNQRLVDAVDDTTLNLVEQIEIIPYSSGSKLDTGSEKQQYSDRVASEIKRRIYDSDRVTKSDEAAFVDIARKELASVLTDPTSVRGSMYRYVLNAMLEQDRLSYEDERWVRSVHQLRVQHREWWFESESAYAQVEVRRLVRSGKWKIRFNRRVFVAERGMDHDLFRQLRPEGLAVNGWWDGLVEVYTPRATRNNMRWGGEQPTSFTRTLKGMIYEGDPYANIWWPVAKIKHPIEFKIANRSSTDKDNGFDNPVARFETIEGSQVVKDHQEYVDWIERNVKIRMERNGNSFWQDGMPDSFCLTLGEGAQKTVKLPAFTFGGRVSLFIVIGTENKEGEMVEGRPSLLRECDGIWWALRDESDMYGGRKIEHEWQVSPWAKRRGHSMDPQLGDNQIIVRMYVEIRMGSNTFGHQDMRAAADPEQQQLLTETVRLNVNDTRIEAVLRSKLFSSLRDDE